MAEILADHNIQSVIHPFLNIEYLRLPLKEYKDVQGYIFTSKNSVRAMGKVGLDRSLPAYVVGPSTAKEVEALGFKNILAAKSNMDSLIELLKSETPPQDLLYCRGVDVSQNIKNNVLNHKIDEVSCYQAHQIIQWADELTNIFVKGGITHILFASMRTVEAFTQSVELHPLKKTLQEVLSRTTILCFGNPMLEYAYNLNAAHYIALEDTSIQSLIKVLKE